jgi:hypothetical protein
MPHDNEHVESDEIDPEELTDGETIAEDDDTPDVDAIEEEEEDPVDEKK